MTISGGGATGWIGLAFRDGVHDQTWQGFRFADAEPTSTGAIVFGQSGSVTPVPPHHITLLDMTIEETITSDNPVGRSHDHAVYFSKALTPGVHDILIDGLTVKAATSGLDSAIHFYHSADGTPNANNVTIRHLTVTGTERGRDPLGPDDPRHRHRGLDDHERDEHRRPLRARRDRHPAPRHLDQQRRVRLLLVPRGDPAGRDIRQLQPQVAGGGCQESARIARSAIDAGHGGRATEHKRVRRYLTEGPPDPPTAAPARIARRVGPPPAEVERILAARHESRSGSGPAGPAPRDPPPRPSIHRTPVRLLLWTSR